MTNQFEGWAYTHPGLKRQENEDCFLMPNTLKNDLDVSNLEKTGIFPGGFFGVFDGMGGHECGAEASKMAANVFLDLSKDLEDDEVTPEGFFQASCEVKEKIGQGMVVGSTATILVLKKNKYLVMNVGDSRCYRYSNGKFKLLTQDHTLAELRVSMGIYERGSKKYEKDSHLLTQYIGQENEKRPMRVSRREGEILSEDYFVLCTDGVYGLCDHLDDKMRQIAEKKMPLAQAGQMIIKEVMEKGAEDNLTLILIRAR